MWFFLNSFFTVNIEFTVCLIPQISRLENHSKERATLFAVGWDAFVVKLLFAIAFHRSNPCGRRATTANIKPRWSPPPGEWSCALAPTHLPDIPSGLPFWESAQKSWQLIELLFPVFNYHLIRWTLANYRSNSWFTPRAIYSRIIFGKSANTFPFDW